MTFERAVEIVLELEGGYSNHAADRGGPTRFGISSAAHPEVDIQTLSRERAVEIYDRCYWTKAHCEDLRPRLRLPVFDAAIQHGPTTAIKLLQRAAGVDADG